MDFDTAFIRLLGNEGGYTVDNGGPTNWGISQRAYPELTTQQIKDLTQDQAKAYYLKDYWGPAGCDLVPDTLKFDLFDFAVNSSARGRPLTAIKVMQRALGLPEYAVDGVIGPQTQLALGNAHPWKLLIHFIGQRTRYYTHLNDALWHEAGKGWMNRVANNAIAV